jgi:tellurite resistance protein
MSGKIIFVVFVSLALAACSSISEETAKSRAIMFVKENVKFYTVQSNQSVNIPETMVSVISVEKSSGMRTIRLHAEAQYLNETKQSNITIKIDMKGNIIEFNGKKVG